MVASFDGCAEPRLRELMQALVAPPARVRDRGRADEAEWEAAIRDLTETGHITDERRQEFILWSDSLGLSMLVDALANPLPAGATESTVLGPFYVPGAPLREYGESIAEEPAGDPGLGPRPRARRRRRADRRRRARRLAERRRPALRGAGPGGPEDHLRGRFVTRDDGGYAFLAVRPVPYTIPDDGPVGRDARRRPVVTPGDRRTST